MAVFPVTMMVQPTVAGTAVLGTLSGSGISANGVDSLYADFSAGASGNMLLTWTAVADL
jgi:hypothetical protein